MGIRINQNVHQYKINEDVYVSRRVVTKLKDKNAEKVGRMASKVKHGGHCRIDVFTFIFHISFTFPTFFL